MDITALASDQFPSLATLTHLNNAAVSLLPRAATEAMNEYLRARNETAMDFKHLLGTLNSVTERLASILGGAPSNYALATSTTEGVNITANALDWPEGSNMVLCDLEFPANYIPWMHVAKRHGVKVRVVESKDGAVSTDDYASKIDENTRVVTASHVQFSTGCKVDIRELAKVAHEAGAICSVDVIQSAGAVHVDLEKWGIDFAQGQGTKWLCGPIGAGFLYASDGILDELDPAYMGLWAVEESHDFAFRDRTPVMDARKLQAGTPAMVCQVGFNESLGVIDSVGGSTREARAMDVAAYLRQCLADEGYEQLDLDHGSRSPIVTFWPKGGHDPEEIVMKLARKGVIVSARDGRIRVSPHFFNTRQHVDRFLTEIGKLLKGEG